MITKINPFAQIYEAFRGFTEPGAFYHLRRQSTGSKIVYSLIISILAALMICGFTVFQIITNKDFNNALTNMPEFSYLDGEFNCEKSYSIPSDRKYLILDSQVDKWDIDILAQQVQGNAQKGYQDFQTALDDSSINEIMLISKTNLVSYKKYTNQFSEMSLAELFNILNISAFSKQTIIDGYKGFSIKVGLLCALFIFPYQFGKLFLMTLLLSLVALIINAICGSKEQFSTLYWITFYMQSIILLIKIIGDAFLSFGGFTLTIACFLFYICMMYRTLKNGEPVQKPVTSYNTNDDLDDFLQNPTTPEPVRSPFDPQTPDTTNSYNTDIFNDANTSSPSSDNTSGTVDSAKPVSGLSLKLKDD